MNSFVLMLSSDSTNSTPNKTHLEQKESTSIAEHNKNYCPWTTFLPLERNWGNRREIDMDKHKERQRQVLR